MRTFVQLLEIMNSIILALGGDGAGSIFRPMDRRSGIDAGLAARRCAHATPRAGVSFARPPKQGVLIAIFERKISCPPFRLAGTLATLLALAGGCPCASAGRRSQSRPRHRRGLRELPRHQRREPGRRSRPSRAGAEGRSRAQDAGLQGRPGARHHHAAAREGLHATSRSTCRGLVRRAKALIGRRAVRRMPRRGLPQGARARCRGRARRLCGDRSARAVHGWSSSARDTAARPPRNT